jgi:hypothetical protein
MNFEEDNIEKEIEKVKEEVTTIKAKDLLLKLHQSINKDSNVKLVNAGNRLYLYYMVFPEFFYDFIDNKISTTLRFNYLNGKDLLKSLSGLEIDDIKEIEKYIKL